MTKCDFHERDCCYCLNHEIEAKKSKLDQEKNQVWLKEAVKMKKELKEALSRDKITTNDLISLLASSMAYDKVTGCESVEQKINIENAILSV